MSEPTRKYSITLPRDIAEQARLRGGTSIGCHHGTAAVARQLERDNLRELITVGEAEHGAISDDEIRAKRELVSRSRERQHQPGTR